MNMRLYEINLGINLGNISPREKQEEKRDTVIDNNIFPIISNS